jgi:hypothetical protein
MKITKVETHVLLVPDYDSEACSSAQDDIVVIVHTDEGLTGIGETDTNPWVAQAMIQARGTHRLGLGLEEMLVGENPLNVEAIWEKLYTGSIMTGRRLGPAGKDPWLALLADDGRREKNPCHCVCLTVARRGYGGVIPQLAHRQDSRSEAPWVSCR